MKKYSRVSYEVRCQIFAFLQVNLSIPAIASRLGFHKSTIYRELKRNSNRADYNPRTADLTAKKRYRRCRRYYAITKKFKPFINSALQNFWSPEQIAGRLRLEYDDAPSHQTIYKYVYRCGYKRYLRRSGRRGAGRYLQKKRLQTHRNGLSIKQRPKMVNERLRIGDWERDTMHTLNGVQLLVCIDRKSRLTKLDIVKERNSKAIDLLTEKLINETGRPALTITNDNGGDFKGSRGINTKIYFCDPYKPQQRGSVENVIGQLRQFVKRKTEVINWGKEKMIELENLINFRPRKVLGYKTPYEVYYSKKLHWQF